MHLNKAPDRSLTGGTMQTSRLSKCVGLLVVALALLPSGKLMASVTASISGTATDPSGATVAGATVIATNTETGVSTTQTTNAQGFYSFQSLALGTYSIRIQQTGFKAYEETGVVLDVNSALVIDAKLQIGRS